MKIKSFIAAILVLLAFSSCNNEVVNETPLPADTETEFQEKGYLVLNLVNPPATRTSVGDEGTEEGSVNESNIDSLIVVLTDKAGLITSVIVPEDMEGMSAKFQVALGGHYVFALVNCPEDVKIEVGGNIHRVIAIAEAGDVTSGYMDGSFMMINRSLPDVDFAGVRVVVNEKHSVNMPARVDVYVDRVVCKIYDVTKAPVEVGFSSPTKEFIDGVDVLGFVLLNVNKKFNLIQTWSDYDLYDEKILSTPLTVSGIIAEQYFHNIGEYTTLAKTDGVISSITDKTLGKDELFGSGPVYATENRPAIIDMDEEGITSGRGETTGVIYKVQAKKNGENSITFYKYKNVLYNELTSINKFPEFSGMDLNSMEIPDLRGLGIQVYEDGIMYYTYYIRDPNTAHQLDKENYYAVFRNSSYRLEINKISLIGDDIPGGGVIDPEQEGGPGNPPIGRKEAFISVNLTVNPWVLNTLKIDF